MIIKAFHMSNAQGNQKKPSKYGWGGKAGAEVAIVKYIIFFPFIEYVIFMECASKILIGGWYLQKKKRKARNPSPIEIAAVAMEFE